MAPAKCANPAPGDDATTHVAQVSVPAPVIVPPPIGLVVATEVTVPAPAGVAHVPSPRQKVDPEALVPLFRCATPRLPVTSLDARSTAELVSACAALAKCAKPAAWAAAVVQVGHEIVPDDTMVPPEIGEVVATLVTLPPPPPPPARIVHVFAG